MRLYLLLLAGAPLPLASNRPLPAALLALAIAVLFLASLTDKTLRARQLRLADRYAFPLTALLIAVVWSLIQMSPHTPSALHHDVWVYAAEMLGEPVEGRIALVAEGGPAHLIRLISYWLFGWMALTLCRQEEQADLLMTALMVIGAAYACYGLIAYFTGNTSLLWYPKWTYFDSLTSTFVNRNSFATYLGLILLTVFALVMQATRMIFSSKQRWQVKIQVGLEFIFANKLLHTLCIVVLLTALALTTSRAGTLSSLLALLLLLALGAGKQKSTQTARSLLSVLVTLCAVLIILTLSANGLFDRFETEEHASPDSTRLGGYTAILGAIADTPLLGTGLGSFEDVFQFYRKEHMMSNYIWTKAHNTYLELVLEWGLPVALIYFSAFGVFIQKLVRGLQGRRNGRIYPALALSATALVGLHSLVDFSLQIPAISVTFAALLGMGLAQSQKRRSRRKSAGPS